MVEQKGKERVKLPRGIHVSYRGMAARFCNVNTLDNNYSNLTATNYWLPFGCKDKPDNTAHNPRNTEHESHALVCDQSPSTISKIQWKWQ